MPSYVVKTDPDRDEFVYWSTIVESPLFAGTEAELRQYLALHEARSENASERIQRAKRTGSSALWPDGEVPYLGFGETAIFEQKGTVKTADMYELTRRLVAEQSVDDLLVPFEDDEQ